MAAVENDHVALHYAAAELLSDEDFFTAAVQKHLDAFWCAADELKRDKEVLTAAVKKYPHALRFATPGRREVTLEAVELNPMHYCKRPMSFEEMH